MFSVSGHFLFSFRDQWCCLKKCVYSNEMHTRIHTRENIQREHSQTHSHTQHNQNVIKHAAGEKLYKVISKCIMIFIFSKTAHKQIVKETKDYNTKKVITQSVFIYCWMNL